MFKHRPAITRTVIFVTTVCVFLIALGFWNNWKARSIQLRQTSLSATSLARAMARQANDTLKQADTVLVGVVERVEHDGTSPDALARLNRFFQTQVGESPALDGLLISDQRGVPIVNDKREPLPSQNDAELEYFAFHRTHTERGPHVGQPVTSRSSGKWIIPVSRRIDHADGSFAGVALATVEVDALLKASDSADVGQSGDVTLISEDGTVMARRPGNDSLVGKGIADTALYRAYKSSAAPEPAYITSEQDGVTRLNSFQRLGSYPLFVVVALSRDETLAAWRHEALMRGAFILALASVIGYGGWRLAVQLTLRNEAEAEVVQARDTLEGLNETLRQFAMQDGLTGLANRRQFDLALAEEFNRAARNGGTLALVLMDVDCFKQFNDIYGHMAGDECLREIARTIAELTPRQSGSLAARYGGEEIVLLLPGTDLDGAVVVAEAVRNGIRGLGIAHTGNAAGVVTLSAGVDARAPADGSVPADLVEAADKALYAAKAAGRDCVRVHAGDDVPMSSALA